MQDSVTQDMLGDSMMRLRAFFHDAFTTRMVGFGLSRTWVCVVFLSTAISFLIPNQGPVLKDVYQGSMLALIVTELIIGLLGNRCEKPLASPINFVMAPLITVIGTCFIPFCTYADAWGTVMVVLAAILTGVGSGITIMMWGKVYSVYDAPATAAEMSLSYVLSGALGSFAVLGGAIAVIPMAILSVIGTMIILWSEFKKLERERSAVRTFAEDHKDAGGGAKTPSLVQSAKRSSALNAKLLIKYVIGALVFGSVVSIIRFFFSMYEDLDGNFFTQSVNLTAALIVMVVMLVVLTLSSKPDLALSYKLVFLFMTASCMLLPFLGTADFALRFTAYLLGQAGYFCFEVISWVILSDLSFRFEIPAYRAFGLGRASVTGGVLLGTVFANFIEHNLTLTWDVLLICAYIMLGIMLLTNTVALTERDIARTHKKAMDVFHADEARAREAARLRENVRPTPRNADEQCRTCETLSLLIAEDEIIEAQQAQKQAEGAGARSESTMKEASLEEKVAVIAREHEITGRALEVLGLLAQGRTAARIEQELFISRGTVNTYCYRIYQKLGIHSRQELLDLIQATALPND